ncbi:hypothetical protein LEP1GSC043_1214 [Leptospira weilii str. Ecochallenge]|uniref:Uncharacterized protein n=1 Tax=Leptospira weilii str. Ecochallenge TaxID=1049986 RepID=N1TWY7_9LEPT|nr:hypothetical protein LEP1GSC043_1214 [Leptospira weilii str. Ecochallenge]
MFGWPDTISGKPAHKKEKLIRKPSPTKKVMADCFVVLKTKVVCSNQNVSFETETP